MGWFSWIVVGLLAGGSARMVTGADQRGCLGTMAVGLLGALVGGALASWAFDEGIGDFGLRSIVIAVLGSILLLLVLQAVERTGRR